METDDNGGQSPASAGKTSRMGSRTGTPRTYTVGQKIWAQLLHTLKLVLFTGVMLSGISVAFIYFIVWPDTPEVDGLKDIKAERPSIILAADGSQLGSFKNLQREWVPLDRISPYVAKALVATEDKRFYEHHGVDFSRTAAALFHTAGGDTQGGSTVTQQLARNLFPDEIGRSRNIMRKLKEMVTAEKIERKYSKDQILEIYLNTVPFLYNVFGIEMASRTYFDKSAAQLNVLESATLVGMLKGTHYYNPVVNPERARTRRNVVLNQLLRAHELSPDDYKSMRAKPLQIRFNRQPEQAGVSTHFTDYVRRWVSDWAEKNDVDLYADGLVINTTLDPELQELAINSVARQTKALQDVVDVEWAQKSQHLLSQTPAAYTSMRRRVEPFRYFWSERSDLLDSFLRETPQFRKAVAAGQAEKAVLSRLRADPEVMAQLRESKTRLEAGFVAIDPVTSEVKAWVGSRDFSRDQFDHVAQAMRQPGSTFKPIVYGAALEMGFSPNRSYPDGPIEIRAPDGSMWKPTDMTVGSGRPMTLRDGLVFSRNTITAQVMRDVGLPDIVSLAQATGITRSRLDPVPSLALGTSPVTLLEMVSAYSTIAQQGEYRKPIVVSSIVDRDGKVVAQFSDAPRRAMSVKSSVELIDMMRGVLSRGTGTAVRNRFGITADVAGKTGTTQFNTDGWFIMMHPNLVAGSWIGFNDARVTIRSDYWGQGGHNALLLVADFFKEALKEKLIDAKAKFPKPDHSAMLMEARRVQPGLDAQITQAESQILVRQAPDGSTLIGDAQGMEMLMRGQQQDAGAAGGAPSVEAPSAPIASARDPAARARMAARQALEQSLGQESAGDSGSGGSAGSSAGFR
ncbi:MAG: penicillin-binding protein [Herminiimonas sp.]|nr:penicillin-binding protein [Herminiimonas sp.]